ncbi:thiamine-repressible mitochondrial transport protein THI74 [Euphorbia lathyris]|uniref:thiamine-repressible mitochondrial transport protein THI74 n=1 Tax=Euphorbia lathyris TaxID=212925 RepID=UPI0033138048
MQKNTWRWIVGLMYIFAVATIWIAASFVVQSVVDAGVSPFLITYICNSLFVVYIPLVEVGRYLEDYYESLFFWRKRNGSHLRELGESEQAILLEECDLSAKSDQLNPSLLVEDGKINPDADDVSLPVKPIPDVLERILHVEKTSKGIDEKGRWTRSRVARVSLVICPFWFLAQLTFNLSLKYTTVTSNTILSTSSSLFTFLVSLAFLGEKFTWLKLVSVLLCMAGTIIVSLGDSETGLSAVASSPLLGDFLSLVSAGFYAIYITLIRLKLPDDDGKSGHVSTAQFLGFLGLFNIFIFLPVAVILHFTMLEPFNILTGEQFGLIVGKGLLDNVLSDYLWAKAVLLTTTTVATAGLTIQVPLAAIVDTLTGHAPNITGYLGALAVMIGFAGINIPSDAFNQPKEASVLLKEAGVESESENISSSHQDHLSPSQSAANIS